jgi:hypothetical protein
MNGRTLKNPSSGEVDQEVKSGLRHRPGSDDERQPVRQKRERNAIKNAEGCDSPETCNAGSYEDIF